jgi:peptidoglycan/LPS O-acetylase OafA/YrhL
MGVKKIRSFATSANPAELVHPKYRADIDGLRAIAVLFVVGYHAFPHWIKGGFIGVDIFFVISGFLISTIIFQSLESKSFSFLKFYSRRIKRIFPALLLVLAFCYLIGWNFLFQSEFKQLNKHIAAGAGFIYNFVSWSEAGYFDVSADRKSLLHLWSLGIEEQFYIFWPIMVCLVWKLRISTVITMLIIIALAFASFIFNLRSLSGDAIAAFYSPFARFWELLIGVILAYFKLFYQVSLDKYSFSNHSLQSCFGAVLIVIGVVLINDGRMFPGWWALLPTIGTVLIISAGSQAWLNRIVLSNPMLVWFGLISFPLYLWHWPLLSFLRIALAEEAPFLATIATIIMSIFLAWLTFIFIEKPIRYKKFNKDIVVACLIFLMVLIGIVAVFSYYKEKNTGLTRTFTTLNPLSTSGFAGGDRGNTINDCGVTNPAEKSLLPTCLKDLRAPPKYALMGDSKASALFPGLIRTSSVNGRWLFIGGTGSNGAPIPLISEASRYSNFQKITRIAVDNIEKNANIKTVVLVTATRSVFKLKTDYSIDDLPETTSENYAEALMGLKNTVYRFISAGKKVVIVVDNPSLQDPSICLSRNTRSELINNLIQTQRNNNCSISIDRHIALSEKYRKLLYEVQETNPENIKIFETVHDFCDDNGICSISKDNHLLYSYSDHISDYASGVIGKKLNEYLNHY